MTQYRTIEIDGLRIFYREAGNKNLPTLLLLHGFPASSFMFRELIDSLSDQFHLIAPDYPGFGYSDTPSPNEFSYTFDGLANVVEAFVEKLGLKRYGLYMQDFGGPVGFRLASRNPEKITGLIVQNANAYEEGLPDSFWGPARNKRNGRGSPTLETRAQRKWKGRCAAEGCTSATRKPGETRCAREGWNPLGLFTGGVAGQAAPAGMGGGRRRHCRRLELGKELLPSMRLQAVVFEWSSVVRVTMPLGPGGIQW